MDLEDNFDPFTVKLVSEFAQLKFKQQWRTSHAYAVEVVMKRFKDKVNPMWEKYILELLNSREPPEELDEMSKDRTLQEILEFEVMYKAPQSPTVKFFTIKQLLECLISDQQSEDCRALKVAPGRVEDLMQLKDPGIIKKVMDNADLHRQFMYQYCMRLPAFMKSKELNPKKTITGSWTMGSWN